MNLPRTPNRTTTGFAFSILDRAIRESLSERNFSTREKEAVLSFFGLKAPECAYCGSPEVRRWDHFVPVRNGGDTVLGNMVLACAQCDDSKQHNNFEEWMRGDNQFSPATLGVKDLDERIEKITRYSHEFHYSPMNIEQRLNKKERERFREITVRLEEIRKDIEELSNGFRERTGLDPIY